MICRCCGKEIPDDARFCKYCGTKAEAAKKICPACGNQCSENAKFCRYCGTDFTQTVVIPVSEPVEEIIISNEPPVIKKPAKRKPAAEPQVTEKPVRRRPTAEPAEAEKPARRRSTVTEKPARRRAAEPTEAEKPEKRRTRAASTAGGKTKAEQKEAAVSPEEKPKTKTKKKGRKLIALLLIVCIIFSCVKIFRKKPVEPEYGYDYGTSQTDLYDIAMNRTPDYTGCSDIRFDEQDIVYTETVEVGPDSTDYTTDSGVSISFDPYTLSDAAHSLTVSSLREKSDGEYRSVAYDFLLDGDKVQLSGTAQISVPYDPAWGDNVFVQYYNEESGSWEILYTETDGNGSATFYTDHFCKFAVFCDMVTGASAALPSDAGQIFKMFGDDPLNMKVMVDYPALAACLRQNSPSTIKETSEQTAAYFVEKGLDTMGFYTSSADTAAAGAETAALLAGGFDKVAGFARSASDMLGHFGAVITVSKLMTDVYRRGDKVDFYETLKDNKNDITALALYAGGALGAGSVAAFCNTAGILLFVYTTADAELTAINLKGSGKPEEFAYREFSSNYLVYNKKTGVCYPRYVADEKEDAETYFRDAVNDIPLPCKAACKYADWYGFFDSIKKLRPDVIPAKIDNVLTQYTSVFWNLPKTDKNTLDRFLKNTRTGLMGMGRLADDYQRPSDYKISEYKASFKEDLYRWLRPYTQECLRSSYFAMLNDAFREAKELEERFNSEISFVLRDPGTENFENSPYANYQIKLSGTQSGDIGYKGTVNKAVDGWAFTRDNGYKLNCTYLSYLLYGTPKYLRLLDGSRDVQSIEITPAYPQTVIEFGEPVQTDSDYVWTLTDVWYGDRSKEGQYPLRLYAIYNNGDNILTPFDYGYEVSFDEKGYGFTINLNSYAFSTSTAEVSSPGKYVRSARDFVFTASTRNFEVHAAPQDVYEASPPYFEVAVKNSKYGSLYYLTDGDSAQIARGSLSAETIKDQFYENGMLLSGGLLIPDAEEDNAGSKVMFDAYGVCYLYTLLPANRAEKTQTEIHHGDIWAFSHADDALD